jgi:hypothetical protein
MSLGVIVMVFARPDNSSLWIWVLSTKSQSRFGISKCRRGNSLLRTLILQFMFLRVIVMVFARPDNFSLLSTKSQNVEWFQEAPLKACPALREPFRIQLIEDIESEHCCTRGNVYRRSASKIHHVALIGPAGPVP